MSSIQVSTYYVNIFWYSFGIQNNFLENKLKAKISSREFNTWHSLISIIKTKNTNIKEVFILNKL